MFRTVGTWDVKDEQESEELSELLFSKSSKEKKIKKKSRTKSTKEKLVHSTTSIKTKKKITSKLNDDIMLPAHQESLRKNPIHPLHEKMSKRLSGARFRWLNEKLYTSTGKEALELFTEDPHLFSVYHDGFMEQVSKWPLNPLDVVIDYIQSLPKSLIIADFGCGNARLAQSVPNIVHSFDLVSVNSHVTACDMSNVPLKDSTVDVCVFCLSLMNTNIIDFVLEAKRVLKINGILKICEITSRFPSVDDFISRMEMCSFKLNRKPVSLNKIFTDFEFILRNKKSLNVNEIILNSCSYKKR